MSLEDEVQHIMDMGAKATPAGIRALTEDPQCIANPVGELVMPILTAYREAILRVAREIDESRDAKAKQAAPWHFAKLAIHFANRFAKPS
jgi:hypothetical protein